MLIRLIGTVRVESGGVPEPVVAAKRACVLAALAARPGVAVSPTELIERVWGTEPPETVLSVLYTYIARLRVSLRSTSARITRTGAHGYMLEASPTDIDVHVVRALAAEGAALADAGRTTAALDRWRQAGDLADGMALAGIGGRWAAEFRAGFARERLDLLIRRYTTELEAGNHQAVLAELVALTEAEPLCEPLVAQLMLAYHRSGRPAEALAHFEALRRRLRDSLGADPSADLRALHVRILDQDPELRLSTTDGPSIAAPVPALLPADIGSFTGRADELATLTALAETDRTTPLATIVGPGGMGKTALAVHWGHSRRALFPGGQLYVNLRGFDRGEPVTPHDALTRLLMALGQPGDAVPEDVDAAAELYRTMTADRRILVVLDNARTPEQVRPLLPGAGCFTIVTSRDRFTGLVALNDARPVRIRVLRHDEAFGLLARVLGTQRVEADTAATERLTELCGHLPLALRIAAAELATDPDAPIASYVERLEGHDRLAALAVDGDAEAAVTANLDLSYQVLRENVRELFCRIGSLPGEDVSAELVTAISRLSEEDTEQALRALVTTHLVEEYGDGRYRMHDLVRLYAERCAENDLAPESRTRLIDDFIEWHHDRAYDYGHEEETNIFLACEALREHPLVWRLVLPLRITINEGRFLARVREAIDIGLHQAERHGDRLGTFRMTNQLASLERMQNSPAAAVEMGRRALAIADDLGPREQTIARGNLGVYLAYDGDMRGAVDMSTEAMDIAINTGNTRSQIIFVNSLVAQCVRIGEFEKAEHHLAKVRELGDELTETQRARLGIQAAEILIGRGHFDEALAVLDEESLAAQRKTDEHIEVWSLSLQAEALYRAGRPEQARAASGLELSMSRSRGASALEPETMCDYAAILVDLGEHREAIALVTTARGTGSGIGGSLAALMDLTLAGAHNGLGEHAVATEHARRAVDAYEAMSCPARLENALLALADAHAGLGNADAARESREAADRISAPSNVVRRARAGRASR